MARLLIIDDDHDVVRLLTATLQQTDERFVVVDVPSMRAGLARLEREPFDCVLLDYRLQDADGLACLREIRARHPGVPVVLMTGWGSEQVAVDAMRLGAVNYLIKHGRWIDAVPGAVREAVGHRTLAGVAPDAGTALDAEAAGAVVAGFAADGIVGRSRQLADVLAAAERVAASQAPVLLEGETGTGKELLARAIHRHGSRRDGPFVVLSCAALPEALLEDELFGQASTPGARGERSRRGLFDTAAGGTLYLADVAETGLATQAKLLRVLEEGRLWPEDLPVDVRLVVATSCPLGAAVRQGRFRKDLWYRLAALALGVPPLRERRDDVAPLAQLFLGRIAERDGRQLPGFARETVALLERWDWPGNVRELQAVVERLAAAATPGRPIGPDLVDPELRARAAAAAGDERPLREIVRCVEAAAIQERLRRYGGRRGATARSLGVTREWLWAKMRRLGLQPGTPREPADG